jgi:hypothetical protein
MRWRMELYHERRRVLVRYDLEAPSPAAAVVLGRDAVRAAYPSARARGSRSLLERAECARGCDGWVLYRIVKDNGEGSAGIAANPGRIKRWARQRRDDEACNT